jgi:hypothetical protein
MEYPGRRVKSLEPRADIVAFFEQGAIVAQWGRRRKEKSGETAAAVLMDLELT